MSGRDPVERAIRKAQAAGQFDDLPGAGLPIPDLDLPYDPAWWARKWVERERVDTEVRALAARLRREVPAAVGLEERDEARARLEALNVEIEEVGALAAGAEPLARLDVDRLLHHFPD